MFDIIPLRFMLDRSDKNKKLESIYILNLLACVFYVCLVLVETHNII